MAEFSPDYDSGFTAGSLAAANGIVQLLARDGHDAAMQRVLAAWAELTQEPAAPVPGPTDLGAPKLNPAQAQQQGFTGDPCGQCGSMRMVRTGKCATCQDCFQTTGCS